MGVGEVPGFVMRQVLDPGWPGCKRYRGAAGTRCDGLQLGVREDKNSA